MTEVAFAPVVELQIVRVSTDQSQYSPDLSNESNPLSHSFFRIEWRKGPSGIKTLCNACGLRYSRAQTRKLKKAQKQQDAESQAVPNSADGSFVSTGGGPHDPYGALPPKPIQIPNSASTATGPTSAGTPHSPFMPIGDYSVHAPLPPLPTPAQDDPPHSAGSTSDNIPTGATGNGNYGAYGNYVNYAFDQWGSPTQNSFSQGQQPGN